MTHRPSFGISITTFILTLIGLGFGAVPAYAVTITPPANATESHLNTVYHNLSSTRGFVRFRYQTGTLNGLTPTATARADRNLATAIRDTVSQAGRLNVSASCSGGVTRCGYFLQNLREYPCTPGYVCLAQNVGLLPPGAGSGDNWVDTLALETKTGRAAPLSDFVDSAHRAAFIEGVNAGVRRALAAEGLDTDPLWAPSVTIDDIHAWLPGPGGMHVWFAKYGVAPGNFGIVHVFVPWGELTGDQ